MRKQRLYVDSNAPYNEPILPDRKIKVTVSVTMSKEFMVKVDDYRITNTIKDEDGEISDILDFSDCNLRQAVNEQVVLPQNAFKYVVNKKAHDDLSEWTVDDMEVVME